MRVKKLLEPGTWVRAKTRTIFGWKGIARVKEHSYGGVVTVIKQEPGNGDCGEATFCREELAVIKPKLLNIHTSSTIN